MEKKVPITGQQGKLGTTNAVMYEVPQDRQALVRITLSSEHTADTTTSIYINETPIVKNLVIPEEGSSVSALEYQLSAGDKITGETSVADKVNYTITGTEEQLKNLNYNQ